MNDVPIIKASEATYVEIPVSARLAILLPTGRWNDMAKSVIGSLVGVANEEVIVLIADNSESDEKRNFLKKIVNINPNIIAISHEINVGGAKNILYLLDWCQNIEYCALMADDDWMSPFYHVDSYKILLENPNASGAAVGTTFVDIGDGKHVDVSQSSMCGNTPIERLRQWNGIVARATMYNVSRRTAWSAAIRYFRTTPLHGLTLAEDLWELNRLSLGDFLNLPGHGCFVHYPANGSRVGDGAQRFYDLLCKDVGLQYQMVYFMGLSTAVQCALFLMGNMSPITALDQREICGQHVFKHVFTSSFLPRVCSEASQSAAASLFANYPEAMAGFSKYCNQAFTEQLYFDQSLVNWFIEVIKVFETKSLGDELPLSERFRQFVESVWPHS